MKHLPITLILAAPRGFCAGVERAVVIVEQALEKYGRPVYVRHEIVHNKFVVDSLKAKGAIFVEELDEVPTDAPVIFSAHGVPKSVPQEAQRRNMVYVDATCPLVSKVHLDAQRHYDAGRKVLLIGHAGHPEVIGTTGQLPTHSIDLIETIEDAENYQTDHANNLAFVTQTTLSADDTADIITVLQKRFPLIVAPRHDDICYATTNRQQAVKDLAKICDAIIVIGAQNSSNSVRLVEVAQKYGCRHAILIPDADVLNCIDFKVFKKIGITAGASAPEILVQAVIKKFQLHFEVSVEILNTLDENVHFKVPILPEKLQNIIGQ
ncbi:MAG: 4-hydroxy-3-methylbut-2-enyl diphosphate reductase [Alphaproteobacteria bacterium]|jgi:4-hydroxy-3-methylbut-2-enyl diphosphate reductase